MRLGVGPALSLRLTLQIARSFQRLRRVIWSGLRLPDGDEDRKERDEDE
jgi:hypothetical protein